MQQAVAGLREVAKLAKVLRERALQEEGKRKEVGAQLEPREVKLEGAQAELATARAEVTYFEVENSKSREDALTEASACRLRLRSWRGRLLRP